MKQAEQTLPRKVNKFQKPLSPHRGLRTESQPAARPSAQPSAQPSGELVQLPEAPAQQLAAEARPRRARRAATAEIPT